jgi:TRAP-type C4-dicarboxylate transport system substrate-binding protein
MYEPILMSKQAWEELNDEQKEAFKAAGQKAEDYFFEAARGLDKELVETFKKNGVEVAEMSKEQFDMWLDVAKQSSYQEFANNVPGGEKLIDKALQVE